MTEARVTYTVGEAARLAGVSVRTLRHYDRIGLLSPADRSEAGYRRYAAADLERLHRILSFRELGISLDQIARLLDDPDADPGAHLREQERLLRDRIARLEQMLAAVHTTMEAEAMGMELTPEERFELFGDFDPAQHEAEAEERWGGTDAYAESRRRTARYSKDDWRRMRDEAAAIERALAAAMESGEPADGYAARAAAEAHRAHIDRWFYPCSPAMHRGLGDLYVTDARFRKHYDDVAPRLAAYVKAAIDANADSG